MSAESGYCNYCGKETEYHVGSNGVLCEKHYEQFCDDEADAMRWGRDHEDGVNERLQEIKSEIGGLFEKLHFESSGNYRIRCQRCGGTFRSESDIDSGLCLDCSETVEKLREEGRRIWRDFQIECIRRRNRVYRQYNLIEMDEKLEPFYFF